MSYIISEVTDADLVGVEGIYVRLQCFSLGSHVREFESVTDSRGQILEWFDYTYDPVHFDKVDASGFENAFLEFFAGSCSSDPPTPLATAQTHINLGGSHHHLVTLKLGSTQSPHELKHIALPQDIKEHAVELECSLTMPGPRAATSVTPLGPVSVPLQAIKEEAVESEFNLTITEPGSEAPITPLWPVSMPSPPGLTWSPSLSPMSLLDSPSPFSLPSPVIPYKRKVDIDEDMERPRKRRMIS